MAFLSCSRIGSAICAPIFCTGLSACIAPWNTIEACAQRSARTLPHFIVVTSLPSTSTSPVTVALLGCMRSTVLVSVDFPQPDSPAIPRVWPASTERLTPRTAGTSRPPVR